MLATYHVVALPWHKLLAVMLERRERGPGSKQTPSTGVLDGFLKSALRLGARVGKGEDDGPVIHLGHALKNLGGEGTTNGRQAHQDGWLDVLNDLLERFVLLALVVVTCKVDLVVSQLTTIRSHQTLAVDEPKALLGFLFRQALLHEELGQLLRDTDTS